MLLWWGPDLLHLYNDAYRPILRDKHPASLAAPAAQVWAEVWDVAGPMARSVQEGGPATWTEDLQLFINSGAMAEETYFTFSYSPVPGDDGRVGGILNTVQETTAKVQIERQIRMLHELAARAADAKSEQEAYRITAEVLSTNELDLPFALLYVLNEKADGALLVGVSGLKDYEGAAKRAYLPVNESASAATWPVAEAIRTAREIVIDDVSARFGPLPVGRWNARPEQAIVLPLSRGGQSIPYAVLVAGISPHRAFDDRYQRFFRATADQVMTVIANARTYESEKKRAEALADIDRAKTTFFSNVSHELRTPLTLLLAPLEALVGSASVPEAARQEIQGSLRSAYRLLKLINDLLDLSKIEAGRMTLRVGPTDLTRILQEVARPWRPALERRNVELVLELPPKLQLVADGERIEQVALNLVSNAVKYVPNGGSLKISARRDGSEAEFVVENSGEGLDPEQVGRLFERFGQSTRSKARRFGSTGLGLPVVRELVELHGGKVTVDNRPGEKVAFCVRLPIGAPIPEAALTEVPLPTSTELLQYEAIAAGPELVSAPEVIKETQERPLLLIAEDNPDVRGFLVRSLKQQFAIVEASDGTQALKLAQERIPALILSDLMMPGLDGIELCKALKASPETVGIPFILLTARADLEGKLAGLRAGADDYVIKPFHLEEIKARLRVQLRLKSLAENLAQNEKLAALGVLVAGVAHEIRNPLNGIINALVPLRTVLGDASKETSELLEMAISSAGRLDQISLQLLQQARVGEGIRAEVDVASNVALAVQLLSYKIQQGPKLVSDIPQGERIRVVGEPGALNQVWINLIDNAIQAAGPSGEVRVRVHCVDHLAKVEVVDNGPGIQPQVIKKIFDPFFTTRQVGSGTGLGLALARDIIQKHGGNITVHSKPGSGAHFKVTLPAAGVS